MKYSIIASALAYLFGDVLEEVFTKRVSRLTSSEILPCRQVKVKKRMLANVTLTAALVHLAEEGHLKLTLDTKRRIFKSSTVFAALSSKKPAPDPSSMEGQIVNNIARKQKKNDVCSLVRRLLDMDRADPWQEIIRQTRKYLLVEGYFVQEKRHGIARLLDKKLIPQCGRIAPLEGEARQLKEMMATFQRRQPELYQKLYKGVAAGIASRQERADADYDVD